MLSSSVSATNFSSTNTTTTTNNDDTTATAIVSKIGIASATARYCQELCLLTSQFAQSNHATAINSDNIDDHHDNHIIPHHHQSSTSALEAAQRERWRPELPATLCV